MVRVLLDRNANIQAADDVSREQSSKCLSWRALLRGIKTILSRIRLPLCLLQCNCFSLISLSTSHPLLLHLSLCHPISPSLTLLSLFLPHSHPLTLPPSRTLTHSSSHPTTLSLSLTPPLILSSPSHPLTPLLFHPLTLSSH